MPQLSRWVKRFLIEIHRSQEGAQLDLPPPSPLASNEVPPLFLPVEDVLQNFVEALTGKKDGKGAQPYTQLSKSVYGTKGFTQLHKRLTKSVFIGSWEADTLDLY